MTENNILYHAAALKRKIAEAEAEYDMIKDQVLAEVSRLTTNAEAPTVEVGELGKFTLTPFRTWNYSPTCKELEQQVKTLKKQEEADGTAKAVEKQIVKFIIKKNEIPK